MAVRRMYVWVQVYGQWSVVVDTGCPNIQLVPRPPSTDNVEPPTNLNSEAYVFMMQMSHYRERWKDWLG